MKSLTTHEILIALFRNLQSWSWDIRPQFTLEREDMEALIPILENHVNTHDSSYFTDMADRFIDNLKDSLANPHCMANRIDITTGKMLQIVLGDYL